MMTKSIKLKLTEQELAAIEARLKASTEGMWMLSPATGVLGSGVVSAPFGRVVALGVASDADAEFIAKAHWDVDALLVHIRAQDAEQVVALRDAIESVVSADALGQDYEALAMKQSNRIQDLEKAFRRVSEIVSYHYGEDENDDSDELNKCFEVLNANG